MPEELGKLVNLEVFDLSENSLSGELRIRSPSVVCSNAHVLTFADSFACFVGELPKELGNLVNVKCLELQRNGFAGTIVCPSVHVP